MFLTFIKCGDKNLKQILYSTYPPLCFYYLPKITNYNGVKRDFTAKKFWTQTKTYKSTFNKKLRLIVANLNTIKNLV